MAEPPVVARWVEVRVIDGVEVTVPPLPPIRMVPLAEAIRRLDEAFKQFCKEHPNMSREEARRDWELAGG